MAPLPHYRIVLGRSEITKYPKYLERELKSSRENHVSGASRSLISHLRRRRLNQYYYIIVFSGVYTKKDFFWHDRSHLELGRCHIRTVRLTGQLFGLQGIQGG